MSKCECGGEVVVTTANATVIEAECDDCGHVYQDAARNTAEL